MSHIVSSTGKRLSSRQCSKIWTCSDIMAKNIGAVNAVVDNGRMHILWNGREPQLTVPKSANIHAIFEKNTARHISCSTEVATSPCQPASQSLPLAGASGAVVYDCARQISSIARDAGVLVCVRPSGTFLFYPTWLLLLSSSKRSERSELEYFQYF